jgi:diadenosine tetraphosphate (Ap4A) HIT family hydrolase
MHATLVKFGCPETELMACEHWTVLYRRHQVTLGSLVLAAKCDATSFAALPSGAYGELAQVTRLVEQALQAFRVYDKINYIMLMMVDPHVHFHVLPRYKSAQEFADEVFADTGWPGPPDLKSGVTPTGEAAQKIMHALKSAFEKVS